MERTFGLTGLMLAALLLAASMHSWGQGQPMYKADMQ
jgi:hypothetical protein